MLSGLVGRGPFLFLSDVSPKAASGIFRVQVKRNPEDAGRSFWRNVREKYKWTTAYKPGQHNINSPNETQLSILISSVISNNRSRRLIIAWKNITPLPGEFIGLFSSDPSSESIKTPLFVVTPQDSHGWVLTNSYAEHIPSSKLGYTQKCLGFWIAYIAADKTTVKSSTCLQTQPTWMKDMKETLQSMKLREIFIPGTHDSGAYREYDPHRGENIVMKYTFTQEEDILSQLIHGVRFLDIRVGYYEKSREKWWTNHSFVKLRPLKDIFNDIITFIQNTDEILIVDFHEFPKGFGKGLDVHKKLVNYIQEALGEYMVSLSLTWNVQLGEIWAVKPRIVVSYNKNEIVANNPKLWPSVAQKWGDAHSPDVLRKYVSQVMSRSPVSKGWAIMAQLTPTTWQVITDEYGGLRNMANMVNRSVTEWFEGAWGQTVNIVAADYFRSTNLVNAAIKWNFIRSQRK